MPVALADNRDHDHGCVPVSRAYTALESDVPGRFSPFKNTPPNTKIRVPMRAIGTGMSSFLYMMNQKREKLPDVLTLTAIMGRNGWNGIQFGGWELLRPFIRLGAEGPKIIKK